MVIGLVLIAILTVVGIGVGAYNLGVSEGISQGLEQSGEATQVVRVVGPRYGPGYGFFPFGFLFFPLFVIGIFLLLRGAFWRGRWGGPGYGPGGYGRYGPWGPRGWQRPEEEERRQDDRGREDTTTRGDPTGA